MISFIPKLLKCHLTLSFFYSLLIKPAIRGTQDTAVTSFALILFTASTASQNVTVRWQPAIMWKGALDFQQVFVFDREIHYQLH